MIPSTRRRVNPSAKARANVVAGRRRSRLRFFSLHESRFRFPTSVSPSSVFSSVSSREIYLLFPTVIAEMMLSNTLDDDSRGTSIRHLILDQFVIPPEHSLNALEPHTFYDANCRAGWNCWKWGMFVRNTYVMHTYKPRCLDIFASALVGSSRLDSRNI